MTLNQGIELAQMAKVMGYVLAAEAGKVQFQILDKDGSVKVEITEWVGYEEAKELMNQ